MIIKITNKDEKFYQYMGKFFGSRLVERQTNDRIYDDNNKEWYIYIEEEKVMASTIRHNRARGTHQIIDMSNIVLTLTQNGWSEMEISKHLGMELDEIIRLKQITGLKETFANHKFSKSWEEFEENRKKN